jgi:hypothetical protein
LRKLSLPAIDYGRQQNPGIANNVGISDEEVYMTQVVMHKLASSIVRRLRSGGSLVNLFSVKPEYPCYSTRPKYDENNHAWPEYYYSLGRTFDAAGHESPTVIPVTNYDLGLAQGFNVISSTFLWDL